MISLCACHCPLEFQPLTSARPRVELLEALGFSSSSFVDSTGLSLRLEARGAAGSGATWVLDLFHRCDVTVDLEKGV